MLVAQLLHPTESPFELADVGDGGGPESGGRALGCRERRPALRRGDRSAQRGVAVAAHPDRRTRALHRSGQRGDRPRRPALALTLVAAGAPHLWQHAQRLVEQRATVLERRAERRELGAQVTGGDTDGQTSPRHHVDARQGLRREQRIAVRQHVDVGVQTDPPGHHRRGRERDGRFEGLVSPAGEPAVIGRRVVGHVGRVEPESFVRARELGDRGAGDQLGAGVDPVDRQRQRTPHARLEVGRQPRPGTFDHRGADGVLAGEHLGVDRTSAGADHRGGVLAHEGRDDVVLRGAQHQQRTRRPRPLGGRSRRRGWVVVELGQERAHGDRRVGNDAELVEQQRDRGALGEPGDGDASTGVAHPLHHVAHPCDGIGDLAGGRTAGSVAEPAADRAVALVAHGRTRGDDLPAERRHLRTPATGRTRIVAVAVEHHEHPTRRIEPLHPPTLVGPTAHGKRAAFGRVTPRLTGAFTSSDSRPTDSVTCFP